MPSLNLISKEDDAAAGQARLAGVLAHDANNLIGKLYAAAGWLESPVHEDALDETRLAIADAVASASVLQAVFHLLSLTPTSYHLEHQPAFCLDLSDQARLFVNLSEAAGVQCPKPAAPVAAVPCVSDVATLRALLVCAARLLRIGSGSKAVLLCSVQVVSTSGLEFTLSASPAHTTHGASTSRPESLALAHARACLSGQGLSWSEPSQGASAWCFTLFAGTERA